MYDATPPPHPRDLLPAAEQLHPFGEATHLDVTAPPFNADPTGREDCTAALVRALDAIAGITRDAQRATVAEIEALPGDGYLPSGVENRKENGKVKAIFPSFLPYLPALYFPAGIYRISDTVSYSFDDLHNSLGSELNRQLRLIGAGRDRTIFRLADHADGFDGPDPKPVITLMRGRRSNVSMANYVQDLTIETGIGNPAAIGLDFFACNTGAVRRVSIRSGDGGGRTGLRLNHGGLTGVLVQEVAIDGFETGIEASGYAVAEHVKLTGQRRCGILSNQSFLSLRRITTEADAPALMCRHPGGQVGIVDSELSGQGAAAIEWQAGGLYADAVMVRGFTDAVAGPEGAVGLTETGGVKSSDGGTILRELALPAAFALGSGPPMERLRVLDPPAFEGVRADETRSGVRAFGARGDGHHDDAPAIQKALDSGAAEILFEAGHYRLDRPVTIPATVRRIDFNFVDLVTGPNLAEMAGQGAFVIDGESDDPLFLESLFAWELWRGKHHTFDHAARRTVVIRDMHTQTSPLYINSVTGGRVFIDNICCTTGVIPGATGHGRACVSFHGQEAWCRQLDPERGEPMVFNDGGRLWVLGTKTEDCGIAYHTINGGRTEVLGGMFFSGRPHTTAIVNEASQARISASTTGGGPNGYYGTAVTEHRDGITRSLAADQFPSRQGSPERGPQYHIPLYTSRKSLGDDA